MAKIQETFDYMKSEIEHASNKQINAIRSELETLEKEADKSAYQQAKKDFESYSKENEEAFLKDIAKQVSDHHIEINKQLVSIRESYVDEIFESVKHQLQSFTDSSDYKKYLENKLKAYSKDFNNDCCIEIRKEDTQYKELILSYFKDAEVKVSDSMHLGGMKIYDAKKYIDDSFENQLSAQRKWFINHSNLTIVKGDE